jgi:hypothetical protein
MYGVMGLIIHTYSKFLMSSTWRPEYGDKSGSSGAGDETSVCLA